MSHWNPSSSGEEPSPADGDPEETIPLARGQPGGEYEPPIWAGSEPPTSQAPAFWADQQPPKAYLRQRPEPPSPRGLRGRAAIVTLALLIVVAGGGAALALELNSQSGGKQTTAPRSGGNQVQGSPARASPQATGQSPSPSPSSAPTHPGVAIAQAAARNAAAPRVAIFLTRYFAAINGHDYPSFRRLLDGQMRQIETAQRFGTGFRSTRDSGATLTAVSQAPDGRLAASVAFTSHQSPADSPDQSACTRWAITLYLERAGGSYVIGPPPVGYQASHQAC